MPGEREAGANLRIHLPMELYPACFGEPDIPKTAGIEQAEPAASPAELHAELNTLGPEVVLIEKHRRTRWKDRWESAWRHEVRHLVDVDRAVDLLARAHDPRPIQEVVTDKHPESRSQLQPRIQRNFRHYRELPLRVPADI